MYLTRVNTNKFLYNNYLIKIFRQLLFHDLNKKTSDQPSFSHNNRLTDDQRLTL